MEEDSKICYKCKWFYIDGVDGEFCMNKGSMYFDEGWSIDIINVQGCNVFYEGEPFDDLKSLDEDSEEVREEKMKLLDDAVHYYNWRYSDYLLNILKKY